MPKQPVRDIVLAASLTLSIASCASQDTTESWYDGSANAMGSGYSNTHRNRTGVNGFIPGSGIELTWDDREALGRIAYAEAGNQGELGIAAVVFTILNRVSSGQFQSTIQDVIDAPNQFEPAMRAGGWRNLRPLSVERGVQFDRILDRIMTGALPDPTNGALFFQNAEIVAARAARGKGSWALVDFGGTPPVAEIGDHRFYDWRAAINLAAARARPSQGYYADNSSPDVADLNKQSLNRTLGYYYGEPDYSSEVVADLNRQSRAGTLSYSYSQPDYASQEVADLNRRSREGSLGASYYSEPDYASYYSEPDYASYYSEPDYASQEVADLNAWSLSRSRGYAE